MAYGNSKETASDEKFLDKAFNIAKNPKYDGYQRALVLMVYTFLQKSLRCAVANWKIIDSQLPEELHKPIIKNFEKGKVRSSSIYHILGANLADMKLISKFNKDFLFLSCITDIYSKYAWIFPLKDKKGMTILFFKKI